MLRTSSRQHLAWIAAIGHAPLLVLIARRSLRPEVLRTNLWAAGATLLAAFIMALIAPSHLLDLPVAQARWLLGGGTFTLGHLAWSAWLARCVLAERALQDR